MLTDGSQINVAAGATSNAFTGRPIEFIGRDSICRILFIADAAGMTAQFLINVGGVQMAPLAAGVTCNTSAAAGQGPKDDEDTMATGVAIPAGARNQLNVSNTTGAGINFRWRAFIIP